MGFILGNKKGKGTFGIGDIFLIFLLFICGITEYILQTYILAGNLTPGIITAELFIRWTAVGLFTGYIIYKIVDYAKKY